MQKSIHPAIVGVLHQRYSRRTGYGCTELRTLIPTYILCELCYIFALCHKLGPTNANTLVFFDFNNHVMIAHHFLFLVQVLFLFNLNSSSDKKEEKNKIRTYTERRFLIHNGREAFEMDKDVYKYDVNGNETELKRYSGDSLLFTYHSIYKYNSKGLKTEESVYFDDDTVLQKTTFLYNSNGNMVESFWYAKDQKLQSRTKYFYDSGFNNTASVSFSIAGDTSGKTFSKFDKQGNKIEEISYCFNSSLDAHTMSQWRYNEKKTIVERLLYRPAYKLSPVTIYKYYDIVYDKNNNWIAQKEAVGDFVKQDTVSYKREIEYY